MIPVGEGDEQCMLCKAFDMANGCLDFYSGAPRCGRNVIITSKQYKEYLELKKRSEKNGKRKIFRFM